MSTSQDETPRIEFMERLAELEQAQARIRANLGITWVGSVSLHGR